MHPNKVDELKQVLKTKKENEAKEEVGLSASQDSELEGKVATLEQDLAQAQTQAREDQEKYLRLYADFENFKKRAAKERSDSIQHVKSDLIEDFLPILDDLDRALTHANNSADVKSLLQGIDLVKKQFQGVFTKLNVTVFDSLGEPFNPHLHEAVSHLESRDYPPNSVVVEYRKGYKMGEKLIRPAMVAVSKEVDAQADSDLAGEADIKRP